MERYARTPSQMIEDRGDQVELCRRFINNDRLSFTKSQISPFTRIKVKKGTNEYDKTLNDCEYIVKKEFIEKTKTSKVSDKMETILTLVGGKLNQMERRNLLSAVPVIGVSQRTKQNLEVERNRELLKIPLFGKYNSPYPDGIAFQKMETEVLPPESYPIFLKYMEKGLPIPKEIEDLFDNPPDPKFYSKLLRIAIKQKIHLGDHLLSLIMSNILNDRADIDQIIQYYHNILRKPILEYGLDRFDIKNPIALLENQTIANNNLFEKLLGSLRKVSNKLINNLLDRYSDDKMKLLIIYSTLIRMDHYSQAKKVEAILEHKLDLQDLQSFIDSTDELPMLDYLSMLYINLLGKADSSDIDLEILRRMIMIIDDIDLKMDLLRLYTKLNKDVDILLFVDIYGNLKGTNAKKFEVLKMLLEMMNDAYQLQDFIKSLYVEQGISEYELVDLIRDQGYSEYELFDFISSRKNELP